MSATNRLEQEYNFFQSNLKNFVQKHPNKYVVIIGESVLGFYNTITDALAETVKKHEPGSFFIELCTDDRDYYNVVLYNWGAM